MEAMKPMNKMTKQNQQNMIIVYFALETQGWVSNRFLVLLVQSRIQRFLSSFSNHFVLLTVRYRHEMLREQLGLQELNWGFSYCKICALIMGPLDACTLYFVKCCQHDVQVLFHCSYFHWHVVSSCYWFILRERKKKNIWDMPSL